MDGFFVLINISKFHITIPKDYSLPFRERGRTAERGDSFAVIASSTSNRNAMVGFNTL